MAGELRFKMKSLFHWLASAVRSNIVKEGY